jgi:hypothetical protein
MWKYRVHSAPPLMMKLHSIAAAELFLPLE